MTDTQHNLAARLAEVRSLSNLSQKELADKMAVSPSLISHWEKGSRVPSEGQLLELARNLGVALDYLLNADVRPHFRFRAKKTDNPELPAIERTLMDAATQIHFVDAAHRLSNKAPRPFSLWAEFTTFDNLPGIAANLRDTLKLNHRVTLTEFKQALSEWNVFVFDWNMPWSLSGLSFRGPFAAIFINRAHTPARRLFTLTHEFAHILFHLGRDPRAPRDAKKSDDNNPRDTVVSIASQKDEFEKQANAFAGEFLMPTDELERLVHRERERLREPVVLDAAARAFNVSRDALFYRLTKFDIFTWTDKWQYFPRNFEPPRIPSLRVEKVEWQVDFAFQRMALDLLMQEKVTTGKLMQWFFTERHILDKYLAEVTKPTDMAISDDNNHDDEPLMAD